MLKRHPLAVNGFLHFSLQNAKRSVSRKRKLGFALLKSKSKSNTPTPIQFKISKETPIKLKIQTQFKESLEIFCKKIKLGFALSKAKEKKKQIPAEIRSRVAAEVKASDDLALRISVNSKLFRYARSRSSESRKRER